MNNNIVYPEPSIEQEKDLEINHLMTFGDMTEKQAREFIEVLEYDGIERIMSSRSTCSLDMFNITVRPSMF